jgi:hypothetical protein
MRFMSMDSLDLQCNAGKPGGAALRFETVAVKRLGTVTDITDQPARDTGEYELSMTARTTTRKLAVSLLTLAIALWAEAGLALVEGGQVMQCSMSAHEMQAMGDMPCCPGDEMQAPLGGHPQCCSVGQTPERPLGFEVSSQKNKTTVLELVAALPASSAAPAANGSEVWRSADAPRFVKPILELKTDLRI